MCDEPWLPLAIRDGLLLPVHMEWKNVSPSLWWHPNDGPALPRNVYYFCWGYGAKESPSSLPAFMTFNSSSVSLNCFLCWLGRPSLLAALLYLLLLVFRCYFINVFYCKPPSDHLAKGRIEIAINK